MATLPCRGPLRDAPPGRIRSGRRSRRLGHDLPEGRARGLALRESFVSSWRRWSRNRSNAVGHRFTASPEPSTAGLREPGILAQQVERGVASAVAPPCTVASTATWRGPAGELRVLSRGRNTCGSACEGLDRAERAASNGVGEPSVPPLAVTVATRCSR